MKDCVLFFDLMGVLIENCGPEKLRDPNLFLDCGPETRTRWLRSPALVGFERGEIPPDRFADLAIAEFNIALPPDAFLEDFRGWVKGFYPGACALVARLRRHYRVGCLSNCNALHWRESWFEHFDYPLASHLIGVCKPDPESFLRMKDVSGRSMDDILFFDDSLVNVEAARSLGVRAYRACGPREIEAICRAEGIE